MSAVRALVLRAPGTNCEHETVRALALAGAVPALRHLKEVQAEPHAVAEAELLVLPGGFSYGDDLGAGRLEAEELRASLLEPLLALLDRGGLVLGICNGFQVLVKLGLLPEIAPQAPSPAVSLTWNDSGRYEDRWVHLAVASRKSPFLRRVPERLEMPVAHAEGKLVVRAPEVLAHLEAAGQVALRYVDPGGEPAGFPWNPNGSTGAVAGLTDPSGRVLGLMPHPERHALATHHPRPGRPRAARDVPDGLGFFASAVETLRAGQ